jgi:REP element-mobilizing transposase RayT
MNRGAGRQAIFFSAADGMRFESLLGNYSARHRVEVHALCLMTNHFHLLVRCPEGGLSAFMHDLSTRYARYANDQRGTDGPLFRGRFRSLLIDSDAYLAAVGRYIHRNAKDLPGVVDLVGYRWSSLRYYAGRSPAPQWLTMSVLSDGHPTGEDYARFVQSDAGTSSSVPWAVATALAERDDFAKEGDAYRLARCVATALLDVVPAHVRADIDRWLQFPTPRARAVALSRARGRAAEDDQFAAVARRALELCTGSTGSWDRL